MVKTVVIDHHDLPPLHVDTRVKAGDASLIGTVIGQVDLRELPFHGGLSANIDLRLSRWKRYRRVDPLYHQTSRNSLVELLRSVVGRILLVLGLL
jgi:hypothetical protein